MRLLRRHWAMVAVGALVGLAVGLAVIATRSPEYRSSAEVLVTALPPADERFLGLGLIHESAVPARTMQTAAEAMDEPAAADAVARSVDGWSADRVRDNVSVDAIGGTEVLAVSATAERPGVAARIANEFTRHALAIRWRRIRPAIEARVAALRARERASRRPSDDRALLETVRDQGADPTLSVLRAARPSSAALGSPGWVVIASWLLGGALLGAGLAVVREHLDRRVADEDEAAQLLGAPVLGRIPSGDAARQAFRDLAQAIEQRGPGAYGFVSASQRDGKSTVAGGVAASMADAGRSVTLIDLAPELRGQLPALLDDARSSMEFVLVDAPPVSEDGEAAGVGQHVDLLVGVVRPGHTSVRKLERLRRLLEDSRARVGGLVVVGSPAGPRFLAILVAAWMFLLFGASLPVVGDAENTAAVLVPLTWLAVLSSRGGHLTRLRRRWHEAFAVLPFLAWLVLSIGWAAEWARAGPELKGWLLAAAIFPIVAASLLTTRHLRLALAAFVAGAALSVAAGTVDGRLAERPPVVASDAPADHRFAGAEGDPNTFAAALVAAIAFACGLAATAARRGPRAAWLALATLLFAGLLATGSRGGLVALATAAVAALVLFRPRRRQAAAVGAMLLLAVAVALPATRGRFADLGNDAGRGDLWRMAWRITEDHPVIGAGLNQFRVEARRHVRDSGPLDSVELIVDQPQVPHSLYGQVLAETGFVGLALLLFVLAACAHAAWRAAARCRAGAQGELAVLAGAALVAIAGMLAASVFISTGVEKRFWMILALGPAVLALAARSGQGSPGST